MGAIHERRSGRGVKHNSQSIRSQLSPQSPIASSDTFNFTARTWGVENRALSLSLLIIDSIRAEIGLYLFVVQWLLIIVG